MTTSPELHSGSAVSLDFTHEPSATSWVASANAPESDFPLQNLPLARFRPVDAATPAWRVGAAIGDQVLDLHATGLWTDSDLRGWMAASPDVRRSLRQRLFEGLRSGSALQAQWQPHLHAQSAVQYSLPCEVGDYTDFYIGIHHATTVGKLFRPDNPLLPNYKWVPIGYHGRASSIVVSGTDIVRPQGQRMPPGSTAPVVGPTQRLDHELELAVWVGQGNAMGEPISIDQAGQHIAGLTLLNDWSARDIQPWEYQPLGPFIAKNFASTVSPWVVSVEALAPFRCAMQARAADDPQPLPYLHSEQDQQQGVWDITLEAWLQTPAMRERGEAGVLLSRSSLRDGYWTLAQLIAHHTVGGCNLRPGDVLGTGTLSGPLPEQGGSLLELTQGGKQPLQLPGGEQRTFLQDGDSIILRAYAQTQQTHSVRARRIGFGQCVGTVVSRR